MDFFSSILWRYLTFGISASIGFSFIISHFKASPDAQTHSRQSAGTILIFFSWIIAIVLTILTFYHTGALGGFTALIIAPIAAATIVVIARLGQQQ